jgi:uridine kinase
MHDSLARAAAAIAGLPPRRRVLVAIDGVDGAGKTTFADALVEWIERPVVRASADGFHNPRSIRYRRGRESPEGFYLDSFDLAALTELLLTPFAGGRPFVRRFFDHTTDSAVDAQPEWAPDDAVLILDGLFLHRAELRDRWDLSILLDVSPHVAAQRFLEREGEPPRQRYPHGQELDFADAQPAEHASLVLPW